MKITAKGNSAWLVLTEYPSKRPVVIRTRDIIAVSQNGSHTDIAYGAHGFQVEENYINILRALEVNIPLAEMES